MLGSVECWSECALYRREPTLCRGCLVKPQTLCVSGLGHCVPSALTGTGQQSTLTVRTAHEVSQPLNCLSVQANRAPKRQHATQSSILASTDQR